MSTSRKNLILSCAALLGIGFAAVIWMVQNQRPSGPTDQWARQVGFASAARYNQVLALAKGMQHQHDLTDQQLSTIEDVLQHDGPHPKQIAVIALEPILSFSQQRQAVQIIKPYIGESDLGQETYMVLRSYWADGNRPLLRTLAHDPQPAVAKMAAAVISGSGVNN